MKKFELKTIHYVIWLGILGIPVISTLPQYDWYRDIVAGYPAFEFLVLLVSVAIGCGIGYLFSRVAKIKFW